MDKKQRNLLQRAWNRLWDVIMQIDDEDEQQERSIGMARLREQLWRALDEAEETSNGWAYPIDIFLDDVTGDLFAIVTQAGKLFSIPMTVSDDSLVLGNWTQVIETFQPVQQTRSNFTIRRDAAGNMRWSGIAATSILNRVAEIDSSELFDNFIKRAEDTGKYPRLDFYHLGESDPEKWEFGTADYLDRDGVCYIASGLFDEEHPLARATIKAAEEGRLENWGFSIEFRSIGEAETILLEPEVKVPIYKDGVNTRISLVLEEDAAGLFTTIGVKEGKKRMRAQILAKLAELYGDDVEELEAFAESVDDVNRTVAAEGLIARSKTASKTKAAAKTASASEEDEVEQDEDVEEEEDVEGEDSEEDTEDGEEEGVDRVAEIELTDEDLEVLGRMVANAPAFQEILKPFKKRLAKLEEQQATAAETEKSLKRQISRLAKRNEALEAIVEELQQEDDERVQEVLNDLPARRTIAITHRPRDVRRESLDDEDGDQGQVLDFGLIAENTLSELPTY